MQNRHIAIGIFLFSLLLSSWIYWASDFKLKQVLTSREWQSKMVSLIKLNESSPTIGTLSRVDITSTMKYLTNGTYLRVSVVKLFSDDKTSNSMINISELGEWELSDDYLLVSPLEIRDISSNQDKNITDDQLQLITQFFKMDAQQSRRVDIINERSIIFTSLNHGSTVLYSNSES